MVKTVFGINMFVFVLWIVSLLNGPETSTSFMNQNFLVSWEALAEGRIWVLVTSAFSHNLFFHLLLNMLVLQGFGLALERTIPRRMLWTAYLWAAVIASLSHAVVSAFLLGEPRLPALGASGAVAGVVMLFALIFPRERIFLFGFVPLPAIWGALLFVGLDVWGLFAQAQGGGLPIGHGAHLGGALTGALFYYFKLRPRRSFAY